MSEMFRICKYCNEQEDKQDRPGLLCEVCICFVHLTCLRRPGTPGDFSCDVFFDFTCQDCSKTKVEIFDRNRFPWVNVLLLTLHHLTLNCYGISNRGYFHYKTHVCSFIDRNWNVLFDKSFKQKKNWIGTIAGVLSIYNGLLVCSGAMELKEGGWWMLMHHFSPAVAAHIVQELAKDKLKWRSRHHFHLEPNLFFDKVAEMGYKHLLHRRIEENESDEANDLPMKKMKRSDSDDGASTSYCDNGSSTSYFDNDYDMRSDIQSEESTMDTPYLQYSDLDHLKNDFVSYAAPSESSSVQHSYHMYDSDGTNSIPNPDQDEIEMPIRKQKLKFEKNNTPIPVLRENMFSTELNSVDLPWEEDEPETSNDLAPVSEYEEIQLFKKITDLIPNIRDFSKKTELRRLRAKLTVRRIKRYKHLPMFDIDKCVQIYSGHKIDESVENNLERILDRFQRSYLLDNLSGTIIGTRNANIVLPEMPLVQFRSPYSGIMLKPIIRRDYNTKPLWVRFQEELIEKASRGQNKYEAGCLEYAYVRPQHIPAVNAFCTHYFWPGIDLSDSLQYPEYSCVVTYKKLIVGVAFLVPDVRTESEAGPVESEAYLSFLCTRTHWQRSKIASFMLYHLLQTCPDRDFTLHVSPTNPAMFLYQKFAFKGEELIQGFYEKYYDCHYKGCTHAIFMRLER